jgi:parvulin-like peptidyl-prolyl isomerase
MIHDRSLATLLASLLLAAGPGPAAAGDVNRETAVVEVGPSTLTAADILDQIGRLPAVPATGDPLADRRRRIQPLVEARLMVVEAEARQLEDSKLRRQLERIERDRLVEAIEKAEIRDRLAVDPAALAEAVRCAGLDLHLHHLQTATEAAADSLASRLATGERFEDLAHARSTDAASAAAGGALPPLTWGQLPPAIEEVAYRLKPGEIAAPFAAGDSWHLVRLDSATARPADPDSLREAVRTRLEDALFSRRQLELVVEMKAELHYTVTDSTLALFLGRMQAWDSAGAAEAPSSPGADRFGFTAAERALAVFTYDGGRFTIGDYSDYMAPEPSTRAGQRAERGRVRRDLDQYFRHHAYSDLARARGYLEALGLDREVRRYRERGLVQKLYQAEVALGEPPGEAELRAHFAAHAERYRGADPARPPAFEEVREQVEKDVAAEREEERYRALIEQLEARYPIVVHEAALLRLPL